MSVLKLECGFWQIPVDDETSLILTLATPFGRFHFQRLPFGVSSALEEFHQIITDTLQGIDGLIVYIEDILIHAKKSKNTMNASPWSRIVCKRLVSH